MELLGSRIGETDSVVKDLSCIDELGDLLLFLDLKNIYKIDSPVLDETINRIKTNGVLEVLNKSDSNTQLACKTAINLSNVFSNNSSTSNISPDNSPS